VGCNAGIARHPVVPAVSFNAPCNAPFHAGGTHLCFSYGLGPRGALCSRTEGRLPRTPPALLMLLASAGTVRGADVTLAFGALDLRRALLLEELVVRWNLRTRPSAPWSALCLCRRLCRLGKRLLTRGAVRLLRRAGSAAGHRETALHSGSGGGLRLHCQPCDDSLTSGLADR
jgi:hypothetical protein